jgi:hypothetical protein
MRRSRSIALFCLVLLPSAVWSQHNALTVPVNLTRMTDRAQVIVQGNIVSTRVEPHPQLSNLMTVVVTVRVADSWKGQTATSHTFRQYLWDIRDRRNAGGYRKGDEVLLFLNPVNERGLTSPVGVEQGRFRILRGPDGSARAVNGRDNLGLMKGTEARLKSGAASVRAMSMAQEHRAGAIAIDSLREYVRAIERSRPAGVKR